MYLHTYVCVYIDIHIYIVIYVYLSIDRYTHVFAVHGDVAVMYTTGT